MRLNPYGLPEIIDPEHTMYGHDFTVQNKWKIPEKVMITQTITGAFYSKRGNPNHPVSPDEILDQALACADAGAPNIHIHVRGEDGHNILCPKLFHYVIDPVRKHYPNRTIVSACMVPFQKGEWAKMIECLQDGLMDETPINTVASFCGDTLFAKPPHVMIEKARILNELNCKAQIAVYSDGDIDNADRYLIKTGALEPPYYWVILPNLPGGSPMQISQGDGRSAHALRQPHPGNRRGLRDRRLRVRPRRDVPCDLRPAARSQHPQSDGRHCLEIPRRGREARQEPGHVVPVQPNGAAARPGYLHAERIRRKLGMKKPGGILPKERTRQPAASSR